MLVFFTVLSALMFVLFTVETVLRGGKGRSRRERRRRRRRRRRSSPQRFDCEKIDRSNKFFLSVGTSWASTPVRTSWAFRLLGLLRLFVC